MAEVRRLHERDAARGYGTAPLPEALERKYPNAGKEWKWQFVFPAARICRNPSLPMRVDSTCTSPGPEPVRP